MFEAILSLCLESDPAVCRDTLVPGYEARTQAECEHLLAQQVPDTARLVSDGHVAHTMHCGPLGPSLDFAAAGPGVFVHRGIISDAAAGNDGDVGNIAFVVGDTSVAVIDSGGSRKVGEALYRAVLQQTELPIRYLILTHMHPDHVLGASVFADAGVEVIGHADLPRALEDRAETYLDNFGRLIGAAPILGTRVVLPDITVEQTLEIDLGGRVLHLRSWPNAHTGTDLTVGDPASGILFTGDLVFDRHAPALDGSVLGWQQVLTEMETLPYPRIVPGHGGPVLDWPGGAVPLAGYLDVLVDDTRAAIARGDSLGQAAETIAQSQHGAWELFDLFNPRNATVAFTELEWE